MALTVFLYLKSLSKSGREVSVSNVSDVRGALEAKLKVAAAPTGNVPVSKWMRASCLAAFDHSWGQLQDKDKSRVQRVTLVFSDNRWVQLNKVLFVHFGIQQGRVGNHTGPFASLRNKAAGIASVKEATIIAGMSRVPGISGKLGDLYFHPPTRLRDALITQRELSRDAHARDLQEEFNARQLNEAE